MDGMMNMDMTDQSGGSSSSHSMTFSISFPGVIVINGWSVTTLLDIVLSLAGLLILTIFFESITRITKHTSVRTLCYMAKRNVHYMTSTLRRGLSEQLAIPEGLKRTLSLQLSTNRWDVLSVPTSEVETVSVSLNWSQRFRYRLLVAFLHVVQMSVAYFIMLSVMTMNVYIISTVIAGSGIGYFLFGGMVKPDEHNKTLLFRRRMETAANEETIGQQTPLNLHGEETEMVTRKIEQIDRLIDGNNDNSSTSSRETTFSETIV